MGKKFDNSYVIGIIFMIIFAFFSPIVMVPIAIISGIVYFLTRVNNANPDFNIQNENRGTMYSSRKYALECVRLYLAPYDSMWRNLRVSNKFCTLRLGSDGNTITGSEKTSTSSYRKFKIVESSVHTMPEIWDMLCLNYDYLTSYDGLKEMCMNFNAVYIEEYIGDNVMTANRNNLHNQIVINTDSQNIGEKLDINNASEIEITALPGISIVLSKKIIKKREEIGGFKSVDELLMFLKLKPHMENQLRPLICTKKMKGSVKIRRTQERSVDL